MNIGDIVRPKDNKGHCWTTGAGVIYINMEIQHGEKKMVK